MQLQRYRNNHSAPLFLPTEIQEIPGTHQRDPFTGKPIEGTAHLKPILHREVRSGEVIEVDPTQDVIARTIALGYLVPEFDPRPQKQRLRGIPVADE